MDQSKEVPAFTIAQINAAVSAMVKAQQRGTDAVAKVLVMAVYASIVGIEGDHVGVANTVYKTVRKSTKLTGIVTFLETFGKLALVAGKFAHFDLGTQAELAWTPEYVETVQKAAAGWESYKPVVPEAEFDVEEKVRAIIDAAAKRQKNGKAVKSERMLANLADALAKFTASKETIES